MIGGGSAALAVSDMDRAVRFYVETLGFKLQRRGGDEWAEVDAGDGFVLALQKAEAGATPGARGSIRIGLTLNQPIAEVVEVLANRGIVFDGPVKEEAGVKVAYFADPEGNVLSLREGRP